MTTFTEGALILVPPATSDGAPGLYLVTEVSSSEGTFFTRVGDGESIRIRGTELSDLEGAKVVDDFALAQILGECADGNRATMTPGFMFKVGSR